MQTVMKMEEILALESADYWGPVSQFLDRVYIDDDYHQKLFARMQERGTNDVPICVRSGILWNGHHRTKIGHSLGFTEMKVTDEEGDSGYGSLSGVII